MCNTILLQTILVVVMSILIVHFNICILRKYIFDASGGKWGKRKLQETRSSAIADKPRDAGLYSCWGDDDEVWQDFLSEYVLRRQEVHVHMLQTIN